MANLKRLYQIGIGAFALLLIFSLLFYKERTIFTDIAFHLFHIAKDGDFTIQNYRFVAVLTQLFPLLAVKAELDLDIIQKLYSIAFPILYFICYILCGSVLKNYRMALAILFFSILFSTDTFFWIQSEMPQGLAIMMLSFSFLYRNNDKSRYHLFILAVLGIILTVFAHPLLLFPFLFIAAFHMLDKTHRRASIIATAVFVALAAVKYFFLKTPYDSAAFEGINNFSSLFPDYFTLFSNKRFLLNAVTKYHFLMAALSFVVIFYLRRKDWKRASLVIIFFFGYLLLINVSYPHPQTANFYIENLYLPLAVIVAIPFFDILCDLKLKPRLLSGIAGAVLLTCFVRIAFFSSPYVTRVNWLRNYVETTADRKQLVDEKKTPTDVLFMTWGTPYEIWLLSTTEKSSTASIVISDRIQDYFGAKDDPQLFITTWGVDHYKALPKRYFIMKDTVSTYEVVQ